MSDILDKTYRTRSFSMLIYAPFLTIIGAGSIGFSVVQLQEKATFVRYALMLFLGGLFLIGLALLGFMNRIMGMPKLILSSDLVTIRRVTGRSYAKWSSLAPFDLGEYGGVLSAEIIGRDADPGTIKMRRFYVPIDQLKVDGEEMLAELERWRTRSRN